MNNIRQLKFRIWSPSKNKFIDKSSHHMDYYRIYGETTQNLKACKFSCGEWLYDLDDAIIQQFTGLKDKEGKEIYEGDIILFDHSAKYGAVKWISESDGWDYSGWHSDNMDYGGMLQSCKVIGNMFENSELIK